MEKKILESNQWVFGLLLVVCFSSNLFAKSLQFRAGVNPHIYNLTTVFKNNSFETSYPIALTTINDCTDLFISEYIEGTSFNKAIEIYNPTADTINLSNYTIRYYNGSSTSVSGTYSSWSGTIEAYGTIIVANVGASVTGITSNADFTTNNSALNFNGNDAVALFKNGVAIDIIGPIGSSSNFAKDKTMIRKSTVNQGLLPYDITEWEVFGVNYTDSLGTHSSECTSFVPTCDTYSQSNIDGCDSVSLGDSIYYASTQWNDTLLNTASCDSIITTTITVNESYSDTLETVSGIDSVEVNGTYYYTNQILNLALSTVSGCDSLIEIPINIISSEDLDTVAFQSFELTGDTWSYLLNQPIYNTSGDVWDSVQSLYSMSPTEGAYLWGMQDLDNSINSSDLHTISFNTIDVSGYSSLNLSFDYYSNLYGGSDFVNYSIQFDNGSDWDSIVELNNNSDEWITEEVNVPNGTQYVRLQLRGDFNGGSDYAGFDNILLYGIADTSNNCTTIDTTLNIVACTSYLYADSTYTISTQVIDTLTQTGNTCDSIVQLNLTIHSISTDTIINSTCLDTLEINGESFTSTGVYTQTLINALGCDSVVTLDLTFNSVSVGTISETTCLDTLEINGESFTSTGVYTQTLTNALGCDSVVTLNLTFNSASIGTVTEITCLDNLEINGESFTSTGVYTQTLTNALGCDSVVTLDLTFNTSSTGTISETTCLDTLEINGESFTSTGIYTQTLTNALGCDSILILDLRIGLVDSTSLNMSTCDDSLVINSSVYISTGVYEQVQTNINGCDSIITLNLEFVSEKTGYITELICEDSIVINNVAYNSTGVYFQTIENSSSCDSILEIDLTFGTPTELTIADTTCNGSL